MLLSDAAQEEHLDDCKNSINTVFVNVVEPLEPALVENLIG